MSDCIEFQGSKSKNGYGRVARMVDGKRRMYQAHRLAYAERHGEIPNGLHVLHKCDNRACINVEHLFLGTHADNMRDMYNKGRGNRPKGSKHHAAKLTEKDIPAIMELLAVGHTQKDIGDRFGVSHYAISDIKLGKRWAHLF